MSHRVALTALVGFLSLGPLSMPEVGRATPPSREIVTIRLRSAADGRLRSFQVDWNPPQAWPAARESLQKQMRVKILMARNAGQEEPEVALRIDDRLQFQDVADVLLAVSRIQSGDRLEWLITDVRLRTLDTKIGPGADDRKYLEAKGADRLKLGLDAPERMPEGQTINIGR